MAKAPAKKSASREVATNQGAMPDWMKDYANEGQDDISRDDITMPRLKLGQQMSPEVQAGKAKEGDLIHNITGDVICKAGDTLNFIPIAYSKEWILWYDRKGPHGGGIAARAKKVIVDGQVRYMWDKPNQTFKDKLDGRLNVEYQTKRFIDEDGLGDWGSSVPDDPESPPAATAHQNYVIMLPDHDNQLIAISLSRTAEGKAKEFNTMLKMGSIPTYARIYKMGSFQDQRDTNKFANYMFSGFEVVQDQGMFEQLREMHQSLKERGVNVDFSDDDDGGAARRTSSKDDDGKF